ncbi:MAG TPA: AAA family ATPase [Steroidobacteraceae bacterium]|nr:AAA family ATPase [Steroidobacteraceae bacterium]
MMVILAVTNLKGGVGKTTTATNLGCAIGETGARVLVVDLDGSAFALTRAFGLAPSQAPASTFEVMTGQTPLAHAVRELVAPGVDLLAARRELASLELQLVSEMGRETVLAQALAGRLDAYDVVLLDCPPTLSLLTVNAIFAAQQLLVPVSLADAGAVQGAAELRGAAQRARSAGASVEILAAVRCKVDERRLASRAIDSALGELGMPVAQTTIPNAAAFDTSIALGAPLLLSQPDHRGAWAHRRLANELGLTRTTLAAVA